MTAVERVDDRLRVLVCGQGYVGLPLAVRAALAGHSVVGYDIDAARIKRLGSAESYVEDVPSALLRRVLDDGSFHPSSEPKACAGFDVAVITVPTPLRDGVPDLSYVEACAATVARYLRPGATVILESTTYPGTTEELLAPILEDGSGLTAGTDFRLGYSPERIDPGNETWTFPRTPKVVAGIDAASLAAVQGFYPSIVDTTVPVSSCRSAELTKLLENTFRYVNTVRDFVELALAHADLDWERRVRYNTRYERPSEVGALVGDAQRARTCLGWTPSVLTPRLVTPMVDADVQRLDDQLSGRAVRVNAVI